MERNRRALGNETIFKLVHGALPTLIFLCMEFPYLDKKENSRYFYLEENALVKYFFTRIFYFIKTISKDHSRLRIRIF